MTVAQGWKHSFPPAAEVAADSLTAIAAVARNGAIGDGADIPWRIPEDWKRFKAVTMGGVLLVGRKTHDGMGNLPGRSSIVVTRDESYEAPGAEVAHTIERALELLEGHAGKRRWVVGGGEIYRLFWPYTTDLDITEVDQAPDVETRFPEIDPLDWAETSRTPRDGWAYVTFSRQPRVDEG
ncbi:MAG TPA: dihydrofolate reductase [Propionibacteriaceae bacterium]|nr:dihydrofolate reductase [Propionibacteriaceae bacterium]